LRIAGRYFNYVFSSISLRSVTSWH